MQIIKDAIRYANESRMAERSLKTRVNKLESTELWFHKRTGEYLRNWPTQGKSLLEVGIGNGHYLHLYPKKANIILGDVTITKELKKRIRNGMHTVRLSAEDLSFKDQIFDIYISHKTIAHLRNVNRARDEIHRVLYKNGLIFLSTVIKGPLGFGLHKNEKGERVLSEDHINEFKSTESLINHFCNGGKFRLIWIEKKPIKFAPKSFLPRKIVKIFASILDSLLLPLPLYYYEVFLILEKH